MKSGKIFIQTTALAMSSSLVWERKTVQAERGETVREEELDYYRKENKQSILPA